MAPNSKDETSSGFWLSSLILPRFQIRLSSLMTALLGESRLYASGWQSGSRRTSHQMRRAFVVYRPLRDDLRGHARGENSPGQPDDAFTASFLSSCCVTGGKNDHVGVQVEIKNLSGGQKAVFAGGFVRQCQHYRGEKGRGVVEKAVRREMEIPVFPRLAFCCRLLRRITGVNRRVLEVLLDRRGFQLRARQIR